MGRQRCSAKFAVRRGADVVFFPREHFVGIHLSHYVILDMTSSFNRTVHIRVMTFNTFNGGSKVDNGEAKVLSQVRSQTPDVVFFQENTKSLTQYLRRQMGLDWYFCVNYADDQQRNVIMTRFPVVQEFQQLARNTPMIVGCQIAIGQYPQQELLNLWSVHFYWGTYGPYAACNRHLRDPYQLYLCEKGGLTKKYKERPGRLEELLLLMKHPPFWSSLVSSVGPLGSPMILAGDFNSPSHLDWIPQVKSEHCGWSYKWPLSSLLADYGFTDSYRRVHPDPRKKPGYTWSTIYKFNYDFPGIGLPEPQDRIDRIYYKSYKLAAIGSWVTQGSGRVALYPNESTNQWPSDHAAVVTDFVWQAAQSQRQPQRN